MSKKIKIGPGVFITSAFIGPGTVTLCLLAGVNTGLSLLWAVFISTLVTAIIQDMCVRLGFYSRQGLEDTLRSSFVSKPFKWMSNSYILAAIFIGNSAYQSGNLASAKFGLQLMGFPFSENILLSIIAIICIIFIFIGSQELLKKALTVLVILMFISFILLGIVHLPDAIQLSKTTIFPALNAKDLALTIGLIGTTIVPYNLFLHSNLIAESKEDISTLRKDSLYSIFLGGALAVAIVLLGTSAIGTGVKNFKEMALLLENKHGYYYNYFLAVGLFASGLASSMVAPFVAALVTNGIFHQSKSLDTLRSKVIQTIIVLIGYAVATTNLNNITMIKVAQALNGLLLPIVVIYLLIVLNDRKLMRVHKNNLKHNILGIFVMIIILLLAAKSILNLF
jgi:manganese transport protein